MKNIKPALAFPFTATGNSDDSARPAYPTYPTKRSVTRLSAISAPYAARLAELMITVPSLLLVSCPTYLFLASRHAFSQKPIFEKVQVSGQGGTKTTVHYFNLGFRFLAGSGLLFDVVSGKLALVGRAITRTDDNTPQPQNGYLQEAKPGIFSLWNIRKNSRIGHEGQIGSDWEYRFTQSPRSDLGVLLRTIPALTFSSSSDSVKDLDELNLFDIRFTNTTMKEAVQELAATLNNTAKTRSVFFVNPDCLNKTFADSAYKKILQQADHVFPDGIGLVIAGKMLRTPLKENVNGTDMLPYLCEMAKEEGKSFFLLGGKPGVAEAMKTHLETSMGVTVAGCHHGYFDHENDSRSVVEQINQSGADILLVAFGAPIQEKWIKANREQLQPKLALGVGGLFDFYSGNTKRAPRWLRELGLEWAYRILQEPGRMWRRYVIGNPLFLLRVSAWKLQKTRKSHRVAR